MLPVGKKGDRRPAGNSNNGVVTVVWVSLIFPNFGPIMASIAFHIHNMSIV